MHGFLAFVLLLFLDVLFFTSFKRRVCGERFSAWRVLDERVDFQEALLYFLLAPFLRERLFDLRLSRLDLLENRLALFLQL